VTEISTARLLLRPWHPSDRDRYAELNADPMVMRYFPNVLSRQESDASADRIAAHLLEHGFTMWAVELIGIEPFIGFIGLWRTRFEAHFTPCVEIGWRLDQRYWGRGLATEGARASLHFGFSQLKLPEIVAMTAVSNTPSRRVMQRLGMIHNPADDFEHPNVPSGHPLQRHVLYRLKAEDFRLQEVAQSK